MEDHCAHLITCPNRACGEKTLPPVACPSCGTYKGRQLPQRSSLLIRAVTSKKSNTAHAAARKITDLSSSPWRTSDGGSADARVDPSLVRVRARGVADQRASRVSR
ncbi:50S ribosomal protein L32 [Rhodococcus hoagii]|nr:50S ribosomal protein L32 [Prescottella equi]